MYNQDVSQVLNKIRCLKGMEELKQLVEEWNVVAQNLNRLSKSPRIVIPNCLIASQSGTGITMLLGLLTQFLNDTGLVEFVGDTRYFEFVLNRSENHEIFPSFARLIENFRSAAGFRGTFKGAVCVDISEWVDFLDDVRFHRFLEYASDYSDKILFIFLIQLKDDTKIKEVESALAAYLRIRRLKLCFPSVNDLHEYVITHLKDYGFILEPSAKEILSQTINKVLDLECFDGYNTLNNLVDEIIYEKCSHGILEDNLIKVEDLHFFTPEGAWIRQLTQNSKAKAKMGFKMNN